MRSFDESDARPGLLMARRPHASESDPRFAEVFLAHYTKVVQILWRLVGDRGQAEELADDVFWKLHHQPALLAQEDIGGWLYRTATHAGIDALRARARRTRHEREAGKAAAVDPSTPLDDALREEQARQVRAALAQLKPAQAELLMLRNSGLSYKDLAEALDVKPSSVGTLLARAEAEFEKAYRRIAGREVRS